MALSAAKVQVEVREIVLRDKPADMIAVSPKGTVPVLLLPSGGVIDESLDVMLWALKKNDPHGWLADQQDILGEMIELIETCEARFKPHLDRYKYTSRYEGAEAHVEREKASVFLRELSARLIDQPYLFGQKPLLADYAIMPFVRQFSGVETLWFRAQGWGGLVKWLDGLLDSSPFKAAMYKYAVWQAEAAPVYFPVQH